MFRRISRGGFFIKGISFLVIGTFLISNAAIAVPQENPPATPEQQAAAATPDKINIPRDVGIIKSKFVGNDPRFIINIQDAHCNYEAQSNIIKILESLIKNDNLSFVAVEGADGLIDTSWFKAFPDEDVRREVATYFMKKGEITGPEFLSITSDYDFRLFGAETREYYVQNLSAFTSSYPLKEATEKYYNDIKTVLNRLKGYIYSDDLKAMDAKIQDYESKKLPFNEYIRFLSSMCEKLKINIREYDNFFKLVSTLMYEKKIDFKVVDRERSVLIDELSKKSSKDALTELVTHSLSFKVGKVSAAEYYEYLKNQAAKQGIDVTKRFPNLANYIIYNAVYAKIENEKLFADIKKIENAVKEKLFQNEDQRALDKLSRNVDVVLNLINIKLLNDDYDYYETHKDEFAPQVFADFIRKQTARYGFAYTVEPPSDAVTNSIPKLEDFYSIAIKRNEALVNNTIEGMKKEKVKFAVLVTGGFHSDGMAKLLEKQGISYMIVCPSITKEVPTPYIQILTNQRTSFEDILVGATAAAAEPAAKGLLAPYVISSVLRLGEDKLKELSDDIGRAGPTEGDLGTRVDDFLKYFSQVYIDMILDKFTGMDVAFATIRTETIEQLTTGMRKYRNIPDWIVLRTLTAAAERMDEQQARFETQQRLAKAGGRTPGTGAARQIDINRQYTEEEAKSLGAAIEKTLASMEKSGTTIRREKAPRAGGEFVILPDTIFGKMMMDAQMAGLPAPVDVICHPGTRQTRQRYYETGNYNDVQRFYYVRESYYTKLTGEEKNILAQHEELHIKIALGIERVPEGVNEERYINSKAASDIRPIMARLGSVGHMEDLLISFYGDAIRGEIERLRSEGKQAELEDYIRATYTRRSAIDMLQRVLTQKPYQGYDIIIVSSSTSDEAEYQQKMLERAFDGVATPNGTLKNKVCVLSVLDESEGGQIIGQVNTWVRARDAFKAWATKNGLPAADSDIDALFKAGKIKISVYHNGGKGERASPATQSLGNSRGAQKLVGTVTNPKGQKVDIELIPAVVLTTAELATSNDGSRIDTYWGNQISFGTIAPAQIERTNAQFDKFVIKIPKNPKMKDIHDYGTADIDTAGRVKRFIANKTLAKKDPVTGKFVPDPKYKADLDALLASPNAAFDFGPFSMSRDMHYAFIDYWTNVRKILDKMKDNKGRSPISRDIEPAFVQIIVPLVNGFEGRLIPQLPEVAVLDGVAPEAKWGLLDNAAINLIDNMADEYRPALERLYKKDANSRAAVLETVEFFIRYRELFKDLGKIVGTIDLGEASHWFPYKRLLDMANEKFLMLSDIIGTNIELEVDGSLVTTPLDKEGQDAVRAADARALRGIKDAAVAVFIVAGQQVVLSAEEVRKGVEKEGVYVKGSIIQGNCELKPGSRIVNSVINDSQGLIIAENSYVDSSTVPALTAMNSIFYRAIDEGAVKADREIVADAYRAEDSMGRTQINDDRFAVGHTRMRAPVGYDPKPAKEALEKMPVKMADNIKFGDNRYSFQEIRDMECNRSRNDAIEAQARITVMLRNRLTASLNGYVAALATYGVLTNDFAARLFKALNLSNPDSRTRTAMVALCGFLEKYGADKVRTLARVEKRDLLKGELRLGLENETGEVLPTVEPDIYRRDSVRANADIEMPDALMTASGMAYIETLAKMRGKAPKDIIIGVGSESRPSGNRIRLAFIEGARATGATVIDITMGDKEMTSTPMMYFASVYFKLDGIVEVTASHLPVEQNGLKPTNGAVNFADVDMQKWLEVTHDVIDRKAPQAARGTVKTASVMEPYRVLLEAALEGSAEWLGYVDRVRAGTMFLQEAIDKIRPRVQAYVATQPLKGLRLAADSGFGSMGPVIAELLTSMGAQLIDIGPVADYSKAFHDANPNNPDNLRSLVKTVDTSKSMLGTGFDVDGDRLGVVTRNGQILRGDDISCIIAPVVIREAIAKAEREGVKGYKPVIVLNVLCSERLKQIIRNAGGIPIESAVGFNKVKEVMARPYEAYLGQYPEMKGKPEIVPEQTAEMGVEISSHIMFKENFNADDALFAVVKLLGIVRDKAAQLRQAGKEVPENILDVMFKELPADHHTGEWRTPMVSNQARIEVSERIRQHYEQMAREYPGSYRIINTIDGVKVAFLRNGQPIGWLAVRPSGTSAEIVVVVNSLVSDDALNFIKNDFFGQMALYRDNIKLDKLEPAVYVEQAKGFIFNNVRMPTALEAQPPAAPLSPRTPGTGAARLGGADDLTVQIAAEQKELGETVDKIQARRATNTQLKNDVVIIAIDSDLYTGDKNLDLVELTKLAERTMEHVGVVVVRGKAADLPGDIAVAAQLVVSKGLKVRSIVTQLNSKTYDKVKGEKEVVDKLGTILSINASSADEKVKAKNPNQENYLPVMRLFALSLQIAYKLEPEDISITLSRIIGGEPVSVGDLNAMLVNRILEILPRIAAINTSSVRETYMAVKQALISL